MEAKGARVSCKESRMIFSFKHFWGCGGFNGLLHRQNLKFDEILQSNKRRSANLDVINRAQIMETIYLSPFILEL